MSGHGLRSIVATHEKAPSIDVVPVSDAGRYRAALGLIAVMLLATGLAAPGIVQRVPLGYDEAVHLVVAKALASGHGYVHESLPGSPPHGKYPPLVPFALAGVWRLYPTFPDNVLIMRVLMLAAGAALVAVSYRCVRDALGCGPVEALTVVALAGLGVRFLGHTTSLGSDVPYALLATTSLYWYARHLSGRAARHLALAIGFAALALATRTIGIALFGAFIVHLLLRRRVWASGAAAAGAAAVLVPWQLWSSAAQPAYAEFPPEIARNYVNYAGHLALTGSMERLPRVLQINALDLARSWASLVTPWADQVMPPTAWAVAAAVMVTMVVVHRLIRAVREPSSVIDLYCAGSLALVVAWPWPIDERLLLPLAPFLIYYTLAAITALTARLAGGQAGRALKMSRLLLAGLAIAVLLHSLSFAAFRHAVQDRYDGVIAEFQQMLGWIARNTPPDAILVGDLDPTYYLVTGRKAIVLSYPDPFAMHYDATTARQFPGAARLLEWFRAHRACYVVKDPMGLGPRMLSYYFTLIAALDGSHSHSLDVVYAERDGWFVVHKIRDCSP